MNGASGTPPGNGPSGPAPPVNRRAFGNGSRSTSTPLNARASNHAPHQHSNLRSSTSSLTPHLAPPLATSPGSSSSVISAAHSAQTAQSVSPRPVLGRERSQSSASAGGAAQLAAERAGQWLAALAPRGEGRGREFITSTLSGVATVASTVGQEVNGFIKAGNREGRPNSFVSAGSPPEIFAPRAREPRVRRDSSLGTVSPPPNGNANGRRAPQPANMNRLGASHQSSQSLNLASPISSPTQSSFVRTSTPLPQTAPPTASTSPAPGTGANPAPPSPGPSHVRRGSQQSISSVTRTHARSASAGPIAPAPLVVSSRLRAAGMPYKIGFQPSGVRHDRSSEFLGERKARAVEREKEEGRLGRRWAKLVDLHFNPATQVRPPTAVPSPNRKASLLSKDTFDAINPKEVWKGLKMATGPNPEEARKRAAEQTIVKWEDDAEVKKCRICLAGFSLSTRKHHCRLCGRIVCSLPPTPPALLAVQQQLFAPADATSDSVQAALPPGTRREKCSLLLVADYRNGRGEEVDEGFVGWMTLDDGDDRASSSSERDPSSAFRAKRGMAPTRRTHTRGSSTSSALDSRPTTPLPQQPQEVQVKGVRVCRECWAVVSRKQHMADHARITPFQRLYVALRRLQSQIEGRLPDFEEELGRVKSKLEDEEIEDTELEDLVAAHKALLTLLGKYDVIAKRISAIPCAEGGSQATVQGALARSAATFLAKALVTVHEVPRLQRAAAAAKAKHMVIVETRLPDVLRAEGIKEDQAEEVALALQPLLEQQSQLESFIAEANAQRKYDDSRSLSAALAEIESEIARLTASALT